MENPEINLLRVNKNDYGQDYQKHLFEQYKLYIEMADRISARRMLANSFFVGVHTALIAAFTIMLKEKVFQANLISLMPFVGVMLLCFVWWKIVHSYKQLNSGKFRVIHAIEQLLPIALYDAEWEVLEYGKNRKTYLPLTHVENWVPMIFLILYMFLAINLFI